MSKKKILIAIAGAMMISIVSTTASYFIPNFYIKAIVLALIMFPSLYVLRQIVKKY